MPKENRIASETETIYNVVRPSVIRPVFTSTAIREITKPGGFPRHQHMGYEVIFVDRGIYRCRHNEIDFVLGKNGLLIVATEAVVTGRELSIPQI